jgi:hypothetical protein
MNLKITHHSKKININKYIYQLKTLCNNNYIDFFCNKNIKNIKMCIY